MKHLRQYIRQLLNEDLGKYIWPDRASGDSRHYDGWRHPIYEEDTKREEELWDTFYQYLIKNEPSISQKDIKDILKYTNDSRYNDVFMKYKGGKLYRGQILPRDLVIQKIFKASNLPYPKFDWPQHDASGQPLWDDFSNPIKVNFEYRPEDFMRSGNLISSWTPDFQTAEQFAYSGSSRDVNISPDDKVSVIFITDTNNGTFLDVAPFYTYDGLDEFDGEDEAMALTPIQIEYVQILDASGWEDEAAEQYEERGIGW